jgi:hypothetical protein
MQVVSSRYSRRRPQDHVAYALSGIRPALSLNRELSEHVSICLVSQHGTLAVVGIALALRVL